MKGCGDAVRPSVSLSWRKRNKYHPPTGPQWYIYCIGARQTRINVGQTYGQMGNKDKLEGFRLESKIKQDSRTQKLLRQSLKEESKRAAAAARPFDVTASWASGSNQFRWLAQFRRPEYLFSPGYTDANVLVFSRRKWSRSLVFSRRAYPLNITDRVHFILRLSINTTAFSVIGFRSSQTTWKTEHNTRSKWSSSERAKWGNQVRPNPLLNTNLDFSKLKIKYLNLTALTVRYLTRRYIGEYKSHTGIQIIHVMTKESCLHNGHVFSLLTDLSYRQVFCIDGSSVEVEIVDVSNHPVSLRQNDRLSRRAQTAVWVVSILTSSYVKKEKI